jgi:hypothetical protein
MATEEYIALKAKARLAGMTKYIYNGSTDKIQGIRFGKGNYTFNGSQIDRSYSYSKIDFQLQKNNREQDMNIRPSHDCSQNQASTLKSVASALGGLFDIQPSNSDYDADQAEYLRKQKKKKKRKGFHL